MHTLLKRQLSNKRKFMKDRRSLPNIEPSQQEFDRDVDEMSLDNEPPPYDASGNNNFSKSDSPVRSGVYPAMLLKEPQLKVNVEKQQRQRRYSMSSSVSTPSLSRPPITEASTLSHSVQSGDHFGTDALKLTTKRRHHRTNHILSRKLIFYI